MGEVIVSFLFLKGVMPEVFMVAGCASVRVSVLRLVLPSQPEVMLCHDKSDRWQHPSEGSAVSRTPTAHAPSGKGLWRSFFSLNVIFWSITQQPSATSDNTGPLQSLPNSGRINLVATSTSCGTRVMDKGRMSHLVYWVTKLTDRA